MNTADLYLDSIDFSAYISAEECRKCGADSCMDLVERLKDGACRAADLPGLSDSKARALEIALDCGQMLPRVPKLSLPLVGALGLLELNAPGPGDPIIVTGNSQLTQEVLLAVFSTTARPFFLVFADTHGDTLDMAIVLGSFTPECVAEALMRERLSEKAGSSTLVIPGRASCFSEAIGARTGLKVNVGPVCAVELPLFFGEEWQAR